MRGKLVETEGRTRPEFDKYAPAYAELLDDPARNRFAEDPLHFHRRKWILIQEFLHRAGVDPATQRWLDVGCGQGELLQMAGGNFAHAAGCDPSAAMLSGQSSVEVHRQTSPVDLPFAASSFDFVTAVCVYHHVHGEARKGLSEEIRRVLRPGGLCCIIEHNPWNPITRAIVKRCPVDADAELLSSPEARLLLEKSGFEAMATAFFLYLPERLFSRLAAVERLLEGVPLGGQYAVLARVRV